MLAGGQGLTGVKGSVRWLPPGTPLGRCNREGCERVGQLRKQHSIASKFCGRFRIVAGVDGEAGWPATTVTVCYYSWTCIRGPQHCHVPTVVTHTEVW